jgi:hypothetical protein
MTTKGNDTLGKSTQVSFTSDGRLTETHFDGITIREYYAGLAMQGFLGNSRLQADYKKTAEACVQMADALIAALNANISE